MTAIDRLMGRLPSDNGAYARLQQCINQLDEVDLILENIALLQPANN
jgi:hypothetical protein